ncbi:MAG: ATP synthase F0 subunit C [Bacteroidales bacterium]|nr:ATP synthase F0 subunit C [Bacteroidales bacterium]MCQ2236142.1 ATP synthase F0 subunit C [Bacteroidales bacterium]
MNLVGVGIGLIVIGLGIGIGNIGKSALDAMARQPEMAGKIQSAMLIAAGMVEGAGLFAIIMAFLTA